MNIIQGEEAISLLSGRIYGDECSVLCPHCGSDFTHIRSAGTLTGSDENEAVEAYPGTVSVGKTNSRRSSIEIVFYCEQCPNLFSLVIEQHKGVNFVQIDTDKGIDEERNGDEDGIMA